MTLNMTSFLTFACLFTCFSFNFAEEFKHKKYNTKKCVPLQGVGTGPNERPPGESLDKLSVAFFTGATGLNAPPREPPIAFRLTSMGGLETYQAVEPYFEGYMEAFGRKNVDRRRQRCVEGVSAEELQPYLDMAGAYSFYFTWTYYAEEAGVYTVADVGDVFAGFGYDPNVCETLGCDNEDTPWGLAYNSHKEILAFYKNDGWNDDGSYNRDYNRVSYEDWRDEPYVPRNDPWTLPTKTQRFWQPLRETDNLGFIYNQEHVVPHIGFTARYIYSSPRDICKIKVKSPAYNYTEEIDLLLERMAKLTEYQKGEIELFDNKVRSLGQLSFLFDIFRGLFPYDLDAWLNLWLSSQAIQEATQLVWRHKVLTDRVRPPSIIRKLRGDEQITTYAGQDDDGFGLGTQTFLGKDFQSYIRTMPHSEYPSGSACVCEASTEYYRNIMGSDYVLEFTNGIPLTLNWPTNSSNIEKGLPSEDITYVFTSWSQISEVCGQSRLDGGMHFTDSVPAGQNLCRSIGARIADVNRALRNGRKPDYVASIKQKKRYQDICD